MPAPPPVFAGAAVIDPPPWSRFFRARTLHSTPHHPPAHHPPAHHPAADGRWPAHLSLHHPHHSGSCTIGLWVCRTSQGELSLLKLLQGVLGAGGLILLSRRQLLGRFVEFLHPVAVGCSGREAVIIARRQDLVRLEHEAGPGAQAIDIGGGKVALSRKHQIKRSICTADLSLHVGRDGFIGRSRPGGRALTGRAGTWAPVAFTRCSSRCALRRRPTG